MKNGIYKQFSKVIESKEEIETIEEKIKRITVQLGIPKHGTGKRKKTKKKKHKKKKRINLEDV